MQIFEFHFNPSRFRRRPNKQIKNIPDLLFDSFCFEPANVYEKRMGSLYMVGLLENSLPQNNRFLDVLAEKIKEKYYKAVSIPPEKSLKESLKTANQHLEKTAKKGDVSWLGNLSFAVISLKNFEVNFTKVGELKLLLLRQGQVIDIDQKLKFNEIEPYPLKIFGNIVSAKLAQDDILLVVSKKVYRSFLEENLLDEISRKPIKKIKNILNGKKEKLTKISGICLLIVLSKEKKLKEKETLAEKKSFKFSSLIENIKFPKIKIPIAKIPFPKIRFPKIRFSKIPFPRINLPKIKTPSLNKPFTGLKKYKKKIILVLILILFFLIGFFVFERKERTRIETYQIEVEQIQEKINQAEYYFDLAEYNLQAKKNANSLYQEAWQRISALAKVSPKIPLEIEDQLLSLKEITSTNLKQLNNLVEISDPELIFEFKVREFIPRRILFFKNELYFFTPLSENIFKLKKTDQDNSFSEEIIKTDQGIDLAVPFSNSIVFFSKPNQVVILKENELSEVIYLEEPFPVFDFASFASFRSHLYFLETKNDLIIRYPFLSEMNWGMPESWLAPEVKTTINFKSMAIDGSVWVLTERNTLQKYRLGRLQETIDLEIFPEIRNFSKIFASPEHAYLYILEPIQKRIIVINKNGEVIKQFQSEEFDNLLDFAVSRDGRTIYLLSGMKMFKVSI